MRLMRKAAAFWLAVLLIGSLLPAAYATEASGEGAGQTDQKLGIFTSDVSGLNSGVDNSNLKLKLAQVNGLSQYQYTKESWENLMGVYEEAKKAVDAGSQETIDTQVQNLEKAIGALVKMNYTPLADAMDAVEELIEEQPELHDVWTQLYQAVENYRPLLTSGDQQAVNEAAAEIQKLLEQRLLYIDTDKEPEIVVQEVEVEVLPTDDYCNIPMHRTWPVLFFISLALNAALAGLIVYILVRKKNTTDDMPLVDYDIDDDIDDEMF